jgi:hypothetical protein
MMTMAKDQPGEIQPGDIYLARRKAEFEEEAGSDA